LTYFEPAYADELREIVKWSFDHLQADNGGSVYLRLSTRSYEQPGREMTDDLRQSILDGGYWIVPPTDETIHTIVAMGAVVPEAIAAQRELTQMGPAPGLLIVTSPDQLFRRWTARVAGKHNAEHAHQNRPHLLDCLSSRSNLVTVLDGHPLSLAWLGATAGFRVRPLGVSKFGMSGYLSEVYREQGIDTATIVEAVLSDSEPLSVAG